MSERMGTHWEGCEEVHEDCKIARLQAENAKLRKHAEAMADAKHVYDWETHAAAYRADFPKEPDHG